MLVNLIRASGNRYTKISNKTRNVKWQIRRVIYEFLIRKKQYFSFFPDVHQMERTV